jgi:deoxyribonuclease IV
MLLGAHVPSPDPLSAAAERGAELAQVFLSPPRAWRPPRPRPDAAVLRAADLPLYVHTPYLVNVVAGDPTVRERSHASVQATCDVAATIGARGVVVHGGQLPRGADPADGHATWRTMLDRLETTVPVLIENTAGGDNAMARHIEPLARLWEAIDGTATPVGVCLDTCHLHAAGEPPLEALARLQALVGPVDLLHVNDARDPFGSGRDRHANLGSGVLDPEVLVELVRRADAPVIVETPGDAAAHAADLAWLRARLGRPSAPHRNRSRNARTLAT